MEMSMRANKIIQLTMEENAKKVIDFLALVAEFHKFFNHPILKFPQVPHQDRVELRLNLIDEEFRELKEAIANKDLVGIADAFADLQYVLSGAILEFGMKEIFPALFAEVHRSNLSKACATEAEADQTIHFYNIEEGEQHFKEFRDGLWFVYRQGDKKTMKSINYSRAALAPIVATALPYNSNENEKLV
jgi:predicted HAD superfamily Cof-like phosphohydrolase